MHDAGYYLQDRSREEYDRIFLEAMKVLNVAWPKRQLMYLAVHWFGWRAWERNRRRNRKRPGWKIVDPTDLRLLPPAAAPDEVPVVQDRAKALPAEEVRKEVDAARQV